MKPAALILLILMAAPGLSCADGTEIDTTTFAISFSIGCDTSSPDVAVSDARVYFGTLQEAPVRIRLRTANTTSTSDEANQLHYRQHAWTVDVTVHNNDPKDLVIPTSLTCSSPNDTNISSDGVLITADGHLDAYFVVGCLPTSGQLCAVRRARPVRDASDQLYVVPDGAVDGTTIQPRRLVVIGVADNTTLHVVRLGSGLNHTSREGSNVIQSVIVNAYQRFVIDVGGTLTLEQLDDGDWSTGDPIGVVASKPVSVFLESSVDGNRDVDVVVQLEPTGRWGNTFVIHRPLAVVGRQLVASRLRTFARVIGGRNATIVRVQYWRPQSAVRWLLLPAAYRHFDIDISAGLATGGAVEFYADHPISVLKFTVPMSPASKQRSASTSPEPYVTAAAAECVEAADGSSTREAWMTSTCDENGNGVIGIVVVTDDLDSAAVTLDGQMMSADSIERLELSGRGRAMPVAGNVTGLLLIGVEHGLHAVTLVKRNLTRHVFVKCRRSAPPSPGLADVSSGGKQNDSTTSSSSIVSGTWVDGVRLTTPATAPGGAAGVTVDVMTVGDKKQQSLVATRNRSVDQLTPLSADLLPNEASGRQQSEINYEVPANASVTSTDRDIIGMHRSRDGQTVRDIKGSIQLPSTVQPCGNVSVATSCGSAKLSEARNYSDLSPGLSSFNVLVPNEVAAASDEHFYHPALGGDPQQFGRSLISSPTVIAVIASLVVAIFFVIACIVGFVVAELLCSKGGLQRVKVSPFVDDYE